LVAVDSFAGGPPSLAHGEGIRKIETVLARLRCFEAPIALR
jgi:hypothetical protein